MTERRTMCPCLLLITCTRVRTLSFQAIQSQWAIPENIHTIPRTALKISEGEGGFTIMEF